jgi:hypothetical protein
MKGGRRARVAASVGACDAEIAADNEDDKGETCDAEGRTGNEGGALLCLFGISTQPA